MFLDNLTLTNPKFIQIKLKKNELISKETIDSFNCFTDFRHIDLIEIESEQIKSEFLINSHNKIMLVSL